METHRKAYQAPVSEMLAMAAQDVVTSSGLFLEEENSLMAAGFEKMFKGGRWVFDVRKGRWQWYGGRW